MKLDPIKYKLENDPLCAIQITELGTNNRLLPIRFWEQIKKQYGSFENMLQTFYNKGVTGLSVQEYRKNGGNAYKKIDNPIEVTAKIVEKEVEHQPIEVLNRPSLSNKEIPFSIDEIRKLDVAKSDAVRLEIENKFLRDKVEFLEKINSEQKELLLENKFNERISERELEHKKANNEFYLGLAEQFGPHVGPALAGMFTKNKSVPLAQPVVSNLSQEKENLVKTISDSNFSNSMANFISDLIYKIHTDNTFYTELEKLINNSNDGN